MELTRRRFIAAGAAGGAAIWLPDAAGIADAASRRRVPLARGGGFSTGVLSGDPGPRSVTLWTRLDDADPRQLRLRLEMATDEQFRHVVLRRDVPAIHTADHTAKVRVGGLQPDTRYWFRFSTKTTHSEVGRTQTAPAPDSQRPIKVGYFACQDFSSGYYGAYQKLLALDPDFVICGGDYIYDRIYADSGYGGVREDKAGTGPDSVARKLREYRAKYRLYRTDPDLHELHRLVPLVAQWDDHEVVDNYVGTLQTAQPQPADDGSESDTFTAGRIMNGWRAWHEYMPSLRYGRSFRTYRKLRFGRNVELFMCDSRSYRENQPCGGSGFKPCDEQDQPRKYLGDEQLAWLKAGLAGSSANWKLVGNQLMIMPFNIEQGVPVEVDSWNGYHAERNDLLAHVGDHAKDVVFLTGDIHTFFAGEVLRAGESGPPVATELVGGSTTSLGTSQVLSQQAGSGALPPELIKPLTDAGIPVVNPWITYAETRTHGCAFATVSEGAVDAQYLGMRDLTTQAGSRDVRTLANLRIARGTPGVTVS
ncbi:MAG: alkaline phosphatase D family protein [Solirubrobacteraceae bacterium]